MKKHILLTNDFFPKLGGIQSYLYEIYSRLDPNSFIVITTKHLEADDFDRSQPFKIIRYPQKVLLPTKKLSKLVIATAREFGATDVIIDPIFPLGLISFFLPKANINYGLIVHGAELTIYARLILTKPALKAVTKNCSYLIAAGNYPLNEVNLLVKNSSNEQMKLLNIPPGVDPEKFKPESAKNRTALRKKYSLTDDDFVIISVSRLVKRKGMDTLIKAADELKLQIPELKVLIGGKGRDAKRLHNLNKKYGLPVSFIGEVDSEELPKFYSIGDVFVMACRNRWFNLEQEGFGIVYLEAAACGLPSIGGMSGGSSDAIVDSDTGILISSENQEYQLVKKINYLYQNRQILAKMAYQAKKRAEQEFNYEVLSSRFATIFKE